MVNLSTDTPNGLSSDSDGWAVSLPQELLDESSALIAKPQSALQLSLSTATAQLPRALKVLVVDDNADDREMVSRALSKIGAFRGRCLECAGGEEALALLADEAVDCVLLDYSLPGLNGIQVLERLRALTADTPIIMMTGQGNEAIAVQAIKRGAQDYISKANITINSLERCISTAVEHSQLRRHIRDQQAALSHTTHLNNAIFDSAPCMIVATDSRGIISAFNKSAEKITGYAADEVIGKATPALLCNPDHLAIRAAYLSETFGQEIESDFWVMTINMPQGSSPEWEFRTRDGRDYPVTMAMTELTDSNGEKVGYLGVMNDITAQKEQEEALRHSERQLRLSMEGAPYGIALVNTRLKWLDANPALCQMLGYSSSELLAIPLSNLVRLGDEKSQVAESFAALLSGKIDSFNREICLLHQNGSEVTVALGVSLVRNEMGRPMHFMLQAMDISERKQMDRMKSEFISVVSHELRTPLTSIKGSLGLLLNTQGDNIPLFARELMSVANRNCERLMMLVNDILDIDKISSGQMRYDMKSIALKDLVEQAIEANGVYAKRLGVTLSADEIDQDVHLHADFDRLVQVLTNLVSNAAKFSEIGDVVEVRTRVHDGKVRISVCDHGIGVPAEYEAKMFTRFAQADSSVARKKNGSGLGLYISKQLAEQMGGTIGYEPTEGGGATFWVEMEQAEAEMPANDFIPGKDVFRLPSAPMTAAPVDARGPLRILHVDDDQDLTTILTRALAQACDVQSARSCREARDMMQNGDFDVIVLDQFLPDGSGLDLLESANDNPDTNYIVWSGMPSAGIADHYPQVRIFRKDATPLPDIVDMITSAAS